MKNPPHFRDWTLIRTSIKVAPSSVAMAPVSTPPINTTVLARQIAAIVGTTRMAVSITSSESKKSSIESESADFPIPNVSEDTLHVHTPLPNCDPN